MFGASRVSMRISVAGVLHATPDPYCPMHSVPLIQGKLASGLLWWVDVCRMKASKIKSPLGVTPFIGNETSLRCNGLYGS